MSDHAGQLHREHVAPARGLRATQYAYEIGSYHYNWHDDVELSVVLTGSVETCVGGETAIHRPGDIYLFNSNDGHATLALQPRSVVLLLRIDPHYLIGLSGGAAIPRFDCRSTDADRTAPAFARLRRLLAAMALASNDPAPAAVARWESRLLEVVAILFAEFAAGAARPAPDPARNAALGRAIEHINGHFRERITLDDLGRAAGYHPTYLSQLFTQTLGVTSTEYLTRLRLRHATRDLGDPARKVVDVAAANGFPDVKAFNLAFRRTFGKTPTAYRALLSEAAVRADEVFHAEYVGRSDADVRSVLEGFVADADAAGPAGGVRAAAPQPAPDDGRLEALRVAARDLAAALEAYPGE